jgi:hypothetical protein
VGLARTTVLCQKADGKAKNAFTPKNYSTYRFFGGLVLPKVVPAASAMAFARSWPCSFRNAPCAPIIVIFPASITLLKKIFNLQIRFQSLQKQLF